MILSRASFRCIASSVPEKPKKANPIVDARKAFEKKRLVSVKENFNKLVMIASSDVKELGDFIKELDEIHRKELFPADRSSKGDADENIFLDQEVDSQK